VIWVIVIVAAVVVLLLFVLVGMFNRLVRLRNRAENAWAQVDVQLRKRYDLIPNLVETVKGYAAHERQTFDEVTQARTAAQQAQGVAQQAQAENALTAAIGRLFAVAEAYPQLRATENFQQLQAQLTTVEQQIAVSRQVYNDTVLTYDNALETVPTNMVAAAFHFRPREYFQTEDATREAPQVQFTEPASAAPQPPAEAEPTPPPAPPGT
jgi:LemA protein